MENRQIWLKPKPTHIDENFEDFLDYLKSTESTSDTLYSESLRLLEERMDILLDERSDAPIYRQEKEPDALTFNVRLCGAWLLAVQDANNQDRKLILLTMLNNFLSLANLSTNKALVDRSFAYQKFPDLIQLTVRIATHEVAEKMPFSWNDLINFKLDMFATKLIDIKCTTESITLYEHKGLLMASKGGLTLSQYTKRDYDKKSLSSALSETPILPEYGIVVSTERDLMIKESQRDDVAAVENFVKELLQKMKSCKKGTIESSLPSYCDGAYVPVEVTLSSPQKIMLKTIDPNFQQIEGELVFEPELKVFSKILYPPEVWAKVLTVGCRLNVDYNAIDASFSLTDAFIDYIYDHVNIGDVINAHNRKGPNSWLRLREFWTPEGFMVFVDITNEEDEKLDEMGGFARIEVDRVEGGDFEGCLYGRICDYKSVLTPIAREVVGPDMLRRFIKEHSNVKLTESDTGIENFSEAFVREYCCTLHLMQSREVNPMLRYRILSTIRIICNLIQSEDNDDYYKYIAQYIKMLILFAKAESNEGATITTIETPKDLMSVDAVAKGADILKILSCFAKDYDATSEILNHYIKCQIELLSKVASLVQAYNRLMGLLEEKTLKGIKKQILNHLSVVIAGDSTLELTNEIEGIFGEEDDMKEFKSSFFVAPSNSKEQKQFLNIFRGICAMMNNRGGVLYLGVNDKGVPIGLKNDLEYLAQNCGLTPTLDAYIIYISKKGEEWFGENHWKYVTLRPMSEYNIVSISIEPYPYDVVSLRDGKAYLRKNNASAPITDEATIKDIRRRRQENLRKTDDKVIILQDAIQKQRKVRLIGYKSSSSGTIQNRVVEPFYIDKNEYIHCYEPESDMVKIFRISRADKIAMLDEPWVHKDKHEEMEIDPFNIAKGVGDEKINVKLQLKLPAKNTIEEQYPGISRYITRDGEDTWLLKTYAFKLDPLIVFYLGNLSNVEIVEVRGLKEAVINYVKKYLPIG